MHAARAHYKAHEAMVVTIAAFTQQAIELVRSCKVEMWDGGRLQKEVLAQGLTRRPVQLQAVTFSAVERQVIPHSEAL